MSEPSQTGQDTSLRYGGIQAVRIIAALLVVAIHTGPLLSWGENADFLLTSGISRIAVPFFFMAAGFLLFRKLEDNTRHDWPMVIGYVKKVAIIYVVAIVLYLPLNAYKGDFQTGWTLAGVLRDLLLDGTFYHLWYLPALAIGVLIVYGLRVLLPEKAMIVLVMALYAIGLMGDSYYGFATSYSAIDLLLESMFGWFDYTRNGLFFAPPFLLLGLLLAKRNAGNKGEAALPFHLILLAGSLALLVGEALWLRAEGWPRHDSMYLMLLPAVWCLFRVATLMRLRYIAIAGPFSLWLYLLHPAGIVIVRMLAKATGLERFLVNQSFVHFGAVVALSSAGAWLICLIQSRYYRKNRLSSPG